MKTRLIILALLASISLSSCSVVKNNISSTTTYLSLTIFQTLDKGIALARTDSWDIVRIDTIEDMYYDGKKWDTCKFPCENLI